MHIYGQEMNHAMPFSLSSFLFTILGDRLGKLFGKAEYLRLIKGFLVWKGRLEVTTFNSRMTPFFCMVQQVTSTISKDS